MSRRLLLSLATVAVLIGVGLPLASLLAALVGDPAAMAELVTRDAFTAAWNTAVLALGTTALAVGLGVPLGVLFGRTDLPRIGLLRTLATMPYVVPPYVSAIAWIALCNPTTGWFNAPLQALGLPVLDIYGLTGMIFVMGLEGTPLVMLATADALGRMDASLEEQARVSGGTPMTVVRRVTLPLAAPAIVAAASAVLAGAAAAFGVPYLLATGTAEPAFVLTTRIAQHLDLDPSAGRPAAVALSVALLAIGATLPALGYAWMLRRSFTTVGGKASRKAPLALGRWRPLALAAVLGFVFIGAVLPLGTLLLMSLTADLSLPPLPGNWSLDNYVGILGRSRDRWAIGRSLWLAAGAATLAVVIGGLVAVLEARKGGNRWLGWAVRLPYAVPGTVLALGLLLAWSQPVRFILFDRVTLTLALGDTAWLLGLAYAIKFAALPVGAVGAALEGFDPALEEAARVSGAGYVTTLRRITLPLLLPTLLTGWFLVFLPAFTEVTMSVLLSGPKTRVVGVLLFELQTYGDPPGAAALAVIVTTVVLGSHLLLTRGGGD